MISSCQWTAQPSCTLLIISPNTDSWCTAIKPDHVDATVNSFVPAKTTRWRQSWYFLNRIRIRIAFIGQAYAQTHTRNLFPVDGVSTGSQQYVNDSIHTHIYCSLGEAMWDLGGRWWGERICSCVGWSWSSHPRQIGRGCECGWKLSSVSVCWPWGRLDCLDMTAGIGIL